MESCVKIYKRRWKSGARVDTAAEDKSQQLTDVDGTPENPDCDESFTQRQGFDDSDGEEMSMTLLLGDDSEDDRRGIGTSGDTPTSCFTKELRDSPSGISGTSVVEKLSQGDNSISNDLVRFNDDGVKDSSSPEDDTVITSSNLRKLVKQMIEKAQPSDTDEIVDYCIDTIDKHFEQREAALRSREIALEEKQVYLTKLQMDLENQRSLSEKRKSRS